jgi:hypothetical protein
VATDEAARDAAMAGWADEAMESSFTLFTQGGRRIVQRSRDAKQN